jgi:hypothetical protein
VREDLVTARRERARLEKFAVRQEKGARSEYRVASHTGYSYAVVLRSLTEHVNSCDCPDFRPNLLGTCKQIEADLLRLRDRRNRTLRFRPPPKDRAEIYVEYGPEVCIRATGPAAKLSSPRRPPLPRLARRTPMRLSHPAPPPAARWLSSG